MLEMALAVMLTAAGLAELVIFHNTGLWYAALGAILGAAIAILLFLNTLGRVIREREDKSKF